jgi:AAA15 family ATPase/GTPase
MITHLTLRNFKSVHEEQYDFTTFDLLVGWNNSGKSTVLQALACIFHTPVENRRHESGWNLWLGKNQSKRPF